MRKSYDSSPKNIFLDSLNRCEADDKFIPSFYERFTGSSEDVRSRFEETSFDKQNRMLLRSPSLAAGATGGDPEALDELTERARTHNRHHLDIKPELYDLWLETLISTAQKFDSKWSESIEAAWRSILGFVIHRMVAKY